MEKILSKDNPNIKRLYKLSQSKNFRYEENLFLLEGVKLAQEAVKANIKIKSVYGTEKALQKYPLIMQDIMPYASQAYFISEQIANKISYTKSPQGIFCECIMPNNQFMLDKIELDGGYLLLSSLQDPGNVGTIIRSCEAFHLKALLLSSDCPDIYSPKILRAAMGSVFRLPIMLCEDVAQTIAQLKQIGIKVYATTLNKHALPVQTQNLSKSSCVVIGNEGNGLNESIINCCDSSLYIPMAGQTESLNASVAASIVAWEMFKGEQNG